MAVFAGASWSEHGDEMVTIPQGLVFRLVEHGELNADGTARLSSELREAVGSPNYEFTGDGMTSITNRTLTMHPSEIVDYLESTAEENVDWVQWVLPSSPISLCTDVEGCGADHRCAGLLGLANGDEEIVLLVGVITEVIPEVPENNPEIDSEAPDQLEDLEDDDEDESSEGVAESEESPQQGGKKDEGLGALLGKVGLEEKPGLADDVELDNLLRSLAGDSRFDPSVEQVATQLRHQPTEELMERLMVLLERISNVPLPDATDGVDVRIAALKLSIRTSLDREIEARGGDRLDREVEVVRSVDEEVEVEVEGDGDREREFQVDRVIEEESPEVRAVREPEVVREVEVEVEDGIDPEVEVYREVEADPEEVRSEYEPEVIQEVRREREPEVVKTQAQKDADRLAKELRAARMAFFDTATSLSGGRLKAAVEVLLEDKAYEDALESIDDDPARFAQLFGLADLSDGVEVELLAIPQLKEALATEVSEYLAEQVKEANKAAIQGTSSKESAPIKVAGELMLIGNKHARRALVYYSLRDDGQKGTVTVIKGGPFGSGKLIVGGISEDALQTVVRESVAQFSKAQVTFE
jgi:hypothetical protein